MTTFQSVTVHTARKPHRCVHCRAMIPSGETYARMAGVWDGSFYSHAAHPDCRAMWNTLFDTYGDWSAGMDFDLQEVITGAGVAEAQADLDAMRGFYPHAVARLELRMREYFEVWGDGGEE